MAECQIFTCFHALTVKTPNPLDPEWSVLQQCFLPQCGEDLMSIHPSFIVAEDKSQNKLNRGGVVPKMSNRSLPLTLLQLSEV